MKWPFTTLFGRRSAQAGCKSAEPTLFSELAAGDIAGLDQQRSRVAAELKRQYGVTSLTGNYSDLANLQKLLDDDVFQRSQKYELQCLGVAFGDVLQSQLPLHWVIITDEYGSDPTLRLGETSININALTMISKRIEQGEQVDLHQLLQQTRTAISRAREEFKS
ncbi:MAG: DUF3806 domain-containing protein [Acidobacteria bacterium]|nr:DUF3806 domain-containing protein [Acidobacteriota bacterium]